MTDGSGGGRPTGVPRLSLHEVTVRFGAVTALAGVSLEVAPGTFLAVVGPSGAGKSTLLWALAGAVVPDRGEVRMDGRRLADRDAVLAAGVDLVPQGNGLAAVLTARENILLPALARLGDASSATRATDAALAAVGLGESGAHLVEELSGGQQQRVAVARALALDPLVLLADEPTSELDHANRELVLGLLRGLVERGRTVVMATHDPEAAAAADHIVRLDEGALTT